MTTIAVRDVGFCAEFSPQGDWAFDYALSLARSLEIGLKVFYLPSLAWDAIDVPRISAEQGEASSTRLETCRSPNRSLARNSRPHRSGPMFFCTSSARQRAPLSGAHTSTPSPECSVETTSELTM